MNMLIWTIIGLVAMLGLWSLLHRTVFDPWAGGMVDEVDMLDADIEAVRMKEEKWTNEQKKSQCRADIEMGFRSPSAARYLYGTGIVDEVRKDMERDGSTPGSRRLK